MAQSNINYGSVANDGTGDPLRTAMISIQNNFVEVYAVSTIDKTSKVINFTNTAVVPNLVVTSIVANNSKGAAGYYLTSNGSAVYWSTPTVGANTRVIFNDSGFSNGSAAFTFIKTSNTLTLANALSASLVTATNINGSGFTSNSSGIYSANVVNAAYISIGSAVTVNSTVYTTSGKVNASVISVGTGFVANSTMTNAFALTTTTNTVTFGSAAGFVANGNFGINNTTPNNKLTVIGTSYFAGNVYVTNTSGLSANGSMGVSGDALLSNGSAVYWGTPVGGINVNATYTMSNTWTFSPGITVTKINQANGTFGTNGQVIISNGTGIYWGTPSSVNSFAVPVGFSNGIMANGIYNGTYSDGIVIDFNGSNGQIGVKTGENINLIVNRDATANVVATANISGFKVYANTFTLGSSSIAANGYSYLPNGLKMQWGYVSANSTQKTVTLPSAFSSAVYNLQATIYGNYYGGYYIGGSATYPIIPSANTTAFTILTNNPTTYTVFWMALGI